MTFMFHVQSLEGADYDMVKLKEFHEQFNRTKLVNYQNAIDFHLEGLKVLGVCSFEKSG